MRSLLDPQPPAVAARWRRHLHHQLLDALARYGQWLPAHLAHSLEDRVLTVAHLLAWHRLQYARWWRDEAHRGAGTEGAPHRPPPPIPFDLLVRLLTDPAAQAALTPRVLLSTRLPLPVLTEGVRNVPEWQTMQSDPWVTRLTQRIAASTDALALRAPAPSADRPVPDPARARPAADPRAPQATAWGNVADPALFWAALPVVMTNTTARRSATVRQIIATLPPRDERVLACAWHLADYVSARTPGIAPSQRAEAFVDLVTWPCFWAWNPVYEMIREILQAPWVCAWLRQGLTPAARAQLAGSPHPAVRALLRDGVTAPSTGARPAVAVSASETPPTPDRAPTGTPAIPPPVPSRRRHR